jgi:hypothetical protein
MFFQKSRSLSRAILHGLTVLGVILAAGGNAMTAYAAIPSNDKIENAAKISANPYVGNVADVVPATTSATDPVLSCTGNKGQDSVWWTFVPPSSGESWIHTSTSEYDTVLAVYKKDAANPGALIELGCDDNSGDGNASALLLPLRGGIRYYIEVVRKTGTAASSPDKAHIHYSFTSKVVAPSTPSGRKWDADETPLFAYSDGWSDFPWFGAHHGSIKISNNVNNTAVAYFDGGRIDVVYAINTNMGSLDIFIDNVLMATVGQNGTPGYPYTWNSPLLSDNVHKLTLRHGVGGTSANFDYIMVFSYPDVIPPGKITSLTAETGATIGKIILKWTATGDDLNVGTATSYDLRYFLDTGVAPDCVLDWASGTTYSGAMPAPGIAGSAQQVTLNGFAPGVKYYFCLAAVDEVGNVGAPSNRVSAIAKTGTIYGQGTYDDIHAGWTYVGNWELVNNPDARNNTQHNSTKIDDFASFSFNGTHFVYTYITGAANGMVDVYIDNAYVTTIDQYTFYPNSFSYTSPMLALGPHNVRFVHKSQAIVTIDQLYVSAVADGGAPDPITDLAAVPGPFDGEVDLSWTAPGDDPGNVGKALKYEVRYSPTPINNEVDWDYALPVAGTLPQPLAGGSLESMTAINLPPGAHYYFAVRTFDNAYYEVLSNTVDSDVKYNGVYAGPGLYEDNHSVWKYILTWNNVVDANATAGHYRRANNLIPNSAAARFWFTGSKFRLTFSRNVGYGKLDVYVDGTKVGTINQNGVAELWNQYWAWTGAAGNHVIEFRVVGNKATIDAIRIWP